MATQITNHGPFTSRVREFMYNGRRVQLTMTQGRTPQGTTYNRIRYMVDMAGTFGGPFTKAGVRFLVAR